VVNWDDYYVAHAATDAAEETHHSEGSGNLQTMLRITSLTVAVGLACCAAALAKTTTSADMYYAVSAKPTMSPNASTGVWLEWTTRDSSSAKPDPLKRVVVHLAQGTNIDTRARVRCAATTEDFQMKGEAACPAKSSVGTGRAQLVTGIGPVSQGGPDPVEARVSAYNAKAAMLVYIRPEIGSPIVAKGVISNDGRTGTSTKVVITLTIPPSAVPGAGNVALSSFSLALRPAAARIAGRARTYLRTPRACPSAKHWQIVSSFSYERAPTETAKLFSPCRKR
jgi:hypothetical protein